MKPIPPDADAPAVRPPARKAAQRPRPVEVLPVNLLLEGRPCLVVGAGKVAARKAEQLIQAGARVTVVGPRASDAIRRLGEQGVVQWLERAFEDDDVAGRALVFAATDDPEANLRVRYACRKRSVLCGCVDWHWREGDLISPAVFRGDDVTVAVSTGGQSCRRSRLVRDSLARHLPAVNSADLLVVGTSHAHLPLRRLEALHMDPAGLDRAGRWLQRIWGVHEFALLSTCNRLELWALAAADDELCDLLAQAIGLGGLRTGERYARRGFDAFEHASLVLAGLLSQAAGESHIVGQVKDAMTAAERRGWAGALLQEWVSNALCTSRGIRAATAGVLQCRDVEDLALAYLEAQRPGFGSEPGMVVGTGTVGRALVERLMACRRTGPLFWCYRSRLPDVRPEWQGRVVPLSVCDIAAGLSRARHILVAISGGRRVLGPEHAPLMAKAGDVVIVDLGMPRGVDPALVAASAGGARLAGLEDIQAWPGENAERAAEAIRRGRETAAGNRDLYEKTIRSIQGRHPEQ